MDEGLSVGAYEALHTRALDHALRAVPDATPQFQALDEVDAPEVLARHVCDAVRRALADEPHSQRLEKINDLPPGVSPSLGSELRAELASADRVDLLCAFIRWHGIRVLADELDALRSRGIPLRILTTTYRGATERRALDELLGLTAPRTAPTVWTCAASSTVAPRMNYP